MDDFYKEYILDHYRNPRNFGHLEHPTAVAEDLNPLCGDKIQMELQVGPDGKVADVRFSGKGCAISQASASMLTESLKGKTLEEVARLSQDVVLDENLPGIGDQAIGIVSAGTYAPGARLPTEAELSQHFQVNRHTVRRALEELSRAALVRVEQGRIQGIAAWYRNNL